MSKTCIIIPGYNVAATIGRIIEGVRKQSLDVVVIDDGSDDHTFEVAKENGAIAFKNAANRGKGASLCYGFDYALSNGYEQVVTMDGDGQHSPKDIPAFLEAIKADNDADIIVGNRMSCPEGMPFTRRITNTVMSKIISCICRQRIPDTQNGFRLIRSSCLSALSLKCRRFEIESEILIEAARKGFKITCVPICSIYRSSPSHINPFIDTLRFIKFIFSYVKS